MTPNEVDYLQRQLTLLEMLNDMCGCQDTSPGTRCKPCELRDIEAVPLNRRLRELLDGPNLAEGDSHIGN